MDNTPSQPVQNTVPADNPTEANHTPGQALEYTPDGEGSRLKEIVSNIPWGKIVFGAVILFLIIWGVVYLFTARKSSTVTVTPAQVEISKAAIATQQATEAQSLLGNATYNAVLQPHFSLESSTITADEPKVALLQSLAVLEQTLNFNLWSHLTPQSDRGVGLSQYEDKLTSALHAVQQWTAQASNKKAEVVAARSDALRRQLQIQNQVNTLLKTDPVATNFATQYAQLVETNNQIALMNNEVALLDQIIGQTTAVLTKAQIRQRNIAYNRNAIIQDIQVVDLDDPGLKLVVKPTVTK